MAEEQPPRAPVPPGTSPAKPARVPDPLALALRNPGVQQLYANGFTLGLTNADTHIVLQLFGRPIAVVNISYTLAKTLSLQLSQLVADWEKNTGSKLQTTDLIDKAFNKEKKSDS